MIKRAAAWLRRLGRRHGGLVQFVKFGMVGVSNTLISLGVYQLCLLVFGLHYQLCNILSFVVSVTNAYYWNSRYVFPRGRATSAKQHLAAYGKAFLSYGGTFLLSTALLTLWVEGCGVSQSLAPVINLLITIPLNFALNKWWAFRNKPDGQEGSSS